MVDMEAATVARPAMAEFTAAFRDWLEGDYHVTGHHGDSMEGRTPTAVFDACLTTRRTVPDAERVFAFWKPGQLVKVGRLGVRVGGLIYGMNDAAVIRWQGKQVSVRIDPGDVGRVAVCDPQGRLLCMATANQKVPFRATPEETRKAIAAMKQRNKVVKAYHEQRPRIANDVAGELYAQRADAAKRDREANPPPAPTLSPIVTPFNDQLEALQRAMDRDTTPMRFIYGGGAKPDGENEPAMKLPSFAEMMAARELQREQAAAELHRDPFNDLVDRLNRKAVGDE